MAHRFSRLAIAATLTTAATSLALPVPAHAADPVAACLQASRVWVVVDNGAGATQSGCATDLTNGMTALKSAGFTVVENGGMVASINGIKADYTTTGTWWGYYHRRHTGTAWNPWEFSMLGAGQYAPKPGTIEGWKVTAASNANPAATPLAWTPPALPSLTGGTVAISGTAKVGQALTATTSGFAPSTATYAYQWRRNGVAIAGATARTYAPTAADAGYRLSVRVTASAPGYTSVLRGSSETAAVVPHDTQAPSTGITIAHGVGKATITLKSRDLPLTGGVGVKTINYRVDGVGSVISTTTNPVNITVGRGTHYITFWGVDKAGNAEAKRTFTGIRVA